MKTFTQVLKRLALFTMITSMITGLLILATACKSLPVKQGKQLTKDKN